jgi:UDP-N-acetylbacillosamine N-acetyltransferase
VSPPSRPGSGVANPALVIWGAAGHARVVADIVRLVDTYEIVGFLDDGPGQAGNPFCGLPVLGGQEALDALSERGVTNIILGFGDCDARLRLSDMVRRKGFTLATAVHPSAVIAADVQVQPGTVVAAGAVINPGTRIGQSVIVNTCASIDHECVVGDAAHVGPGARLGGRVSIGTAAWVGIGATLRDRVTIGARSVIGAGAVVVRDVPAGVVAYGVPAEVKRPVQADAER